jgi:pimeloyl-ACP methyl ester carboxylesterase
MRTEISAGCWIEYDDEGRGAPLVLLHAFPLAKEMWRPQEEALRSLVRVIAPDLRGFGGTSGFTDAPSVETMADDIAALLGKLGISEPVVLCGLSMGGYVALAFARRYADRLRGLVLADTRADPDSPEARVSRDKLISFAQANPSSAVLDQMIPRLLGQTTQFRRSAVVETVRWIGTVQKSEGIVGAIRALRDRPDSTPTLGQIEVPTLVLVGSEDILTPPNLAETMAQSIPNARLVTIERAGHLSNLEQAELFTNALRDFLAELA